MSLETPILFLTYKRFDTTYRVFQSICKAKPKRLYFVNNAPKTWNDKEEVNKVLKIRALIEQIDWDCKISTLFRDHHLNVKESITNSINWFFSYEEKGIILEDDCLPSDSFYSYCEELLNYYEYDEEVYSIGGCNFLQASSECSYSYKFTNHVYIWGWATWRRAWVKYDMAMTRWPIFKRSEVFSRVCESLVTRLYWTDLFNKVKRGEINTWDYQWVYSVWYNEGISIIPSKNLISNIGFGKESNFTNDIGSIAAEMKTFVIDFPLNHPKEKIFNIEEKRYVEKAIYKISYLNLFTSLLYKLFSKIKFIRTNYKS